MQVATQVACLGSPPSDLEAPSSNHVGVMFSFEMNRDMV